MNLSNDHAGELCCYCSLCCNGSIFSHVKLDDAERAELGDSVDYEDVKGSLRLQFPCRQLGSDGACKGYDKRPEICRSFRCQLLKNLEYGEVGFQAAKIIVDDARQLRARVFEALADAGEDVPEVIAERRPSRAVRRLKQARSNGEAYVDDLRFKRALVHFELYKNFIQSFFSKKYS